MGGGGGVVETTSALTQTGEDAIAASGEGEGGGAADASGGAGDKDGGHGGSIKGGVRPKVKMLIQEFSKRTGWTRDTILFYERMGLLRPVRGRGNGYRHYTEAEVELAEQVKMAQTLGFSLAEIKQGVGAYRTGAMTA
jgi:hypothetical protein